MISIKGVTYLQMLDNNMIEVQLLSDHDEVEVHYGKLNNVVIDQDNNTFTVNIQPIN